MAKYMWTRSAWAPGDPLTGLSHRGRQQRAPVREFQVLRAADSAALRHGSAIVDVCADQPIKRQCDEELRVELAKDLERFADALERFAAFAGPGPERCCVAVSPQLSDDAHYHALVRGERCEVECCQVIDARAVLLGHTHGRDPAICNRLSSLRSGDEQVIADRAAWILAATAPPRLWLGHMRELLGWWNNFRCLSRPWLAATM